MMILSVKLYSFFLTAGTGTASVMGMLSFSLDLSVPSRTLGVKRRYLLRMNLKKALLLPEL